jgi:hypothetical protein
VTSLSLLLKARCVKGATWRNGEPKTTRQKLGRQPLSDLLQKWKRPKLVGSGKEVKTQKAMETSIKLMPTDLATNITSAQYLLAGR